MGGASEILLVAVIQWRSVCLRLRVLVCVEGLLLASVLIGLAMIVTIVVVALHSTSTMSVHLVLILVRLIESALLLHSKSL